MVTTAQADRMAQTVAIVELLATLKSRRVHALRKMKNALDGDTFNEAMRHANEIETEIENYRNQLLTLMDELPGDKS